MKGWSKYLILVLLLGWTWNTVAQTVNTESFDGTTFPPTGWLNTQITGTGLWTRVTSGSYPTVTPHSGAALATYNSYGYSAGTQAMLITPQFDLSARGSNTPYVSFWFYVGNYSSSGPGSTLEVYVNTTPDLNGTPTLLGTLNSYNATPTGWTLFSYNIPAAYNLGSNYVIFKATSDYWNNIHLDDVTWTAYGSPMSYGSSTTTTATTNPVPAGLANQQIIRLAVSMGGSTSPLTCTSITFNTNGSTNPTGDIGNARVFATGGNTTFATTTQFGSTVVAPNGSFTVTGSYTLNPGVNYFWLAYDINLAATIGNVVDGQCTSVTVGGTPYAPTVTAPAGSRTIQGALNGVYTINPLGSGNTNFLSFTDAVNALVLLGVSGPVTFNVAAGTYNESITIPAITGASATNTITFTGGVGNTATRILQTTTATQVVKIFGADYIRFRYLTINANPAGVAYGFWFQNALTTTNPGNPCDWNEITNCVINCNLTTTATTSGGILGSSSTGYSTNAATGNNNLFQYNTINGGYFGIMWRGPSSTGSLQTLNNKFLNNTIQNFYYYGLYIYYTGGSWINENTVIGRVDGTTGYSIYCYYNDYAPQVLKNYVWTPYYGIYVYYANQVNSVRFQVANNMVAGTRGTYTYKYLLNVSYSYKADVWYNSVLSNSSSYTYGLYTYGTSAYLYSVKNNMVAHTGTGTYAYLAYNSNTIIFSEYDYNLFWSTTTNPNGLFYFNATYYADLPALKAAFPTFNVNSKWGNPYYISDTDLHSRSTAGYLAGTPVGITDDYDFQPRNATTPCIGADEFPVPPPEKDLKFTSAQIGYSPDRWDRVITQNTPVYVVIQNVGLEANPSSVTVQYQVGANPAVVETFNSVTWTGNTAILAFTTPFNTASTGTFTFNFNVNYPGDGNLANNSGSTSQLFNVAKTYGYETFDQFVTPGFGFAYNYPMPTPTLFNGGGVQTWQTIAGQGVGSTNALVYPGDVAAADDWIFFPAGNLDAGSSYRVRLQYRTASASNANSFAIYAGTAPNAASMQLLVNGTWNNFTNTAFAETRIGTATYPYFNTVGAGNYYLGIRATSAANKGAFYIDNVMLDVNPAPPPKIGFRYEFPATAPFIDDPATARIDLSAIYHTPGVIDRRYQVTNTTNLYGLNGFMLWDVKTTTPWIKLLIDAPAAIPQPQPFNPGWPRENQYFRLVVDPTTLAPGMYSGMISFYGQLWNSELPTSGPGLTATNQIFNVPVYLTVSANGTAGVSTPVTVGGTNFGVGPHVMMDGLGNKIATVTVTSGTIASIKITEYPNTMPPKYTRLHYVRKYWTIDATGTGWTADIEFYYSDTEAITGGVVSRDNLRGWNQSGTNTWAYGGTGSFSTPAINAVTVQGYNPNNIKGTHALATRWNHTAKSGDGEALAFTLDQNYPNPFNPSTRISFAVPEEGSVTLAVYNSMGVQVATLVNEVLAAGSYNVTFDASTLPAGLYMYRLTSGTATASRYMTLVK